MRQKWQTFSPLVPCANKTPFPSNPRPLSPPSPPRKTRSNRIPRKKIPCPTDNKQLPTFFKQRFEFFPREREKDESSGLLRAALEQKTAATFRKKLRGTFRDSGRALRAGPWKLGLKNSRCVRIAFPTKTIPQFETDLFFSRLLIWAMELFFRGGCVASPGVGGVSL